MADSDDRKPRTGQSRLPLVDLLKALASQLIIWHHLAFYGPMSDVVYPHASGVIDWLYDYARIAVQAFLVVGGFLAARSFAPRMEFVPPQQRCWAIPALLWTRYIRLVRPYAAALVVAVVAAAIARTLIQHPATPAPPTLAQFIAHLFFLQGIVGAETLSAGVWYVAIDFQLCFLLILLLWSARRIAEWTGASASALTFLFCTSVAAISLFWLNRQPSLDNWAPYFFGAYGLGILAQWISNQPRKGLWILAMALLVLTALLVDWRSRILVAGVTALLLAAGAGSDFVPAWARSAWITALSRISYSVFLIHYAVCLTVGAIVFRLWPTSPAANATGMAAAWLLSLGAGALLYRYIESPPAALTTRIWHMLNGNRKAPDAATV